MCRDPALATYRQFFCRRQAHVPTAILFLARTASPLLRLERNALGRTAMHFRNWIGTVALAAAWLATVAAAQAADDSKYPDLKGQWERFIVRGLPGQASFDQTKGWGHFQQAPLTPEYQAIFEEN